MVTEIDKTDQKSENLINDEITKNEKESLPKGVYVIAQEIKIVKSLASHDPIQRGKQLRKLSKWLKIRAISSFPFSEGDFLRLWKGLYFSMWMCDKPLNQENLADDLGKLLDCFNNAEISIQFFGAFLKIIGTEWYGIDQWRMDKFLMLIRRMFRAIFQILKKNNWRDDCINSFNSHILLTLSSKFSTGYAMHIMDVFLEELAKISNGNISADTVVEFLQPFIDYLAKQKDVKLLTYIRNRIFYHLLWQSELGREYTDKYNAWKEMGFPTERIDDIEKLEENIENEDEIEENREVVLDPRAGNVDVFIPALPVNATKIVKILEKIQYTEITNTKSRRFIRTIVEKYKILENGNFPLGVKRIPKLKLEPFKLVVDKKVNELKELEDKLYGTTRKLKKLNKKKRRKLLSSINFEELDEETLEDAIDNSITGVTKKKLYNDKWIEEEIKDLQFSQSKKGQNVNKLSTTEKNKKKNKNSQKAGETDAVVNNNKRNKIELSQNNTNDWIESDNLIFEESEKTKTEEKIDSNKNDNKSEWNQPLKEGEIEYFIPSKRIKLKQANHHLQLDSKNDKNSDNLLYNPFSKEKNKTDKKLILGKAVKRAYSLNTHPKDTKDDDNKSSHKKVKIVLKNNTIQKPSDYIRQVRNSPTVPYNAEKKPAKGLLKPNLTPSPIRFNYKMKIFRKMNESF